MTRLEKLLRVAIYPPWLRTLLFRGVAASAESQSALSDLNCRTVVDIGANRGQFSLLARRLFPSARIFAFEPLPGPASGCKAVFANDANVILHEAAIGPDTGQATIHISRCDDSSSLLPITSTQETLFPGTEEASTTTVNVAPLERFLTKDEIKGPALLKLDVQGFELEALKGCETLLDRFAHVYVECSFVDLYSGQALADDVIGWLRERKFRLHGVYNMSYDIRGRSIQADFLFVRG